MKPISFSVTDTSGQTTMYLVEPETAKTVLAQARAEGKKVDLSAEQQGEIDQTDMLAELKTLMPKLRKLASTVALPLVFVLLKMHLFRPDLVLYPFSRAVLA